MSVFSKAQGTSSHWLTEELQASIEYKVLNGKFGTEGLESISQILCELGASSKGYLGALLCPYGTETGLSLTGPYRIYKSTVAVWVVKDPGTGEVNFLRTSRFAHWLKNNVLYNSGLGQTASSRIEELTRKGSASLSPFDSISVCGRRDVPPPSDVLYDTKSRRGFQPKLPSLREGVGRFIPAPSVVNTVTGDHPSYEDNLNLFEAEFVNTPRVINDQGQTAFDPDEFNRRADNLDAARKQRGLRPIDAATTLSTYHR
jgi:hypothetical protein